ncbi:marine proteobacterial sortase target protein [Microbulbifer sp.]|uniref:marine proteobacterial sortase target protein n=1 Tax=Microbulbifer sp. TaxID=1908541 RepID=UPI0025836BEC|nr:marine proteobacterial sortase target protein [Microbulbifer sp.]
MNRPFFHPPRIDRELLILPTDEYYRRRNRRRHGGSWLLFLVTIIAVLVAAVGARAQEMVGEETVSINDTGSGDLLFKSQQPGRYKPALHLGTEVQVNVRGLAAEVTLEQKFTNRSDQWQEAVYVLPLPENAAVNGLEIRIGERRIVGKVRERQQAQKIYKEARAAGKRAALLEQQRPNLFTSRIANIAPGEKISVEVRYLQTLRFDQGKFSLRLPTTLTPRYIPGTPIAEEQTVGLNSHGWALPTDQVADADKITPTMMPMQELSATGSHQVSISVDLGMGLPLADIYSPYHEIDFNRQAEHRYRVVLKNGHSNMDRDFALYWRPQTSAMPSAALFAERGGESAAGDHFLQLLMLPPDSGAAASRKLPREVIFVVDTSGSMSGSSIRQAKESLLLALNRLGTRDRFNVIEFNSQYQNFYPRPVQASAETVQRARDWVESLEARGGTEMAPALKEALSQQLSDEPGELVRQVVFITDGAVGNESALFEIIRQRLGQVRLFPVGIGSAPNSHFMARAAEYGRGAFVQIGDLKEVQQQMQRLFAKLENPLVTDLQIRWPAGLVVEAYPKKLPDLYRGEPVRLIARVEGDLPVRAEAGNIEISGRLAGKRFRRNLSLAGLAVDSEQTSIGSLWARSKIAALRAEQRALPGSGNSLKEQILALALNYQLASPYTSFVAVEETPVRPAEADLQSSPVPNAVARGQVLQSGAYPSTGLGIYAHMLMAVLSLTVGLVLRGQRRLRNRLRGFSCRKCAAYLARTARRWLRRRVPDVRQRRSRLEAKLKLANGGMR